MINLTHDLITKIIAIAQEAGKMVLGFYDKKNTVFTTKRDGSPVSKADFFVNKFIKSELAQLTPEITLVSEEDKHLSKLKLSDMDQFWLIDPLDGTKEFLNGNKEFTVNIALIELGQPILGVICAPALHLTYVASILSGAYKIQEYTNWIPLGIKKPSGDSVSCVTSRYHHNTAEVASLAICQNRTILHKVMGSSLKFCYIAEGLIDIYPRFNPTMEWDTAAGQAILSVAGGIVAQLDGSTLNYGKRGFVNPAFVASSNCL